MLPLTELQIQRRRASLAGSNAAVGIELARFRLGATL
jgi:hypothetical protein